MADKREGSVPVRRTLGSRASVLQRSLRGEVGDEEVGRQSALQRAAMLSGSSSSQQPQKQAGSD
eukprot:2383081-Prorocentrum_lima.AAC.1